MHRPSCLVLAVAALVGGCDSNKKPGIAGSTCSTAADCSAELQCIASDGGLS